MELFNCFKRYAPEDGGSLTTDSPTFGDGNE
jgi:hypothetical protein